MTVEIALASWCCGAHDSCQGHRELLELCSMQPRHCKQGMAGHRTSSLSGFMPMYCGLKRVLVSMHQIIMQAWVRSSTWCTSSRRAHGADTPAGCSQGSTTHTCMPSMGQQEYRQPCTCQRMRHAPGLLHQPNPTCH